MSPVTLDTLTAHYYSSSAKYKDPKHIGYGLFHWEKQALKDYFRPGTRLLVASAGTGREVVALERAGYLVDGFDCNTEFVSTGVKYIEEHGIKGNLVTAPPSRLPPYLGTYDGIIIGLGGYSHIVGRSRRIAFLKSLRSLVEEGDPILLSFYTRKDSRSHRWTAKIGTIIRRMRRLEAVEVGDLLADGYGHFFSDAEITVELQSGGFRMLLCGEDPDVDRFAIGVAAAAETPPGKSIN